VSLPDWLVWPGLVLLGAGVGAYGTLIGAGGGFLLVPLLILLYPELEPEVITAISLGVVWANASSATVAYARQRRIDYVAGVLFAAATVPSSVLGAIASGWLDSSAFEIAFGVLLFIVAVWLLLPPPRRILATPPPPRFIRRLITDREGDTYRYAFDPALGVGLGLAIGFIANIFGVGGGIIYVPAMVLLMRFPSHIATSTSTFILMFTAGAGALVHLLSGHYNGVESEEISLALGVVAGAQVGALASARLARHQQIILRLFSAALLLVSVRLVLGGLLQ
jgi:uncharacterized protein